MVSPSGLSLWRMTSLCFARTRWFTMCDADVFPRELQNHLEQIRHLTTEAGE